MALSTHDQIKKLIDESHSVLVIFGHVKGGGLHTHGDHAASALALAAGLTKLNKICDVVAENFILPQQLDFLPHTHLLRTRLPPIKKTIVKVDISRTGLQSLSYEIKDDVLHLHVTPVAGAIAPKAVRTEPGALSYDLIICIGTPDIHALGTLYTDNAELFTHVPLVNLDHNPANARYGHVNAVDVSACACTEIVHTLLQTLGPHIIDEQIATALLTGLIIKTKSFKTANVNPRTLSLAAELMHAGANREMIVRKLYRSRRLSTLRLWGAALSRMHHEDGWVNIMLTREDFLTHEASEEDLPDVIDEIFSYTPDVRIITMFYESLREPGTVTCLVHAEPPENAIELLKNFLPRGTAHDARATFTGESLIEVKEKVLGAIGKTRS